MSRGEAGSGRRRYGSAQDLLTIGALAATVVGIVVAEEVLQPVRSIPPGRLVTVDGTKVHVMDRPGTVPTVVLESGLGNPLTMWTWVTTLLRDDVSIVTYDRPGIAWSPPTRVPLGAAQYPEHLLKVLTAAGARAPFVLVGHSTGGLLTRMFAARYSDSIAGLVFVDSTHPAQYRRAAQDVALTAFKRQLDKLIWRTTLGLPVDRRVTAALQSLPPDWTALTGAAMLQRSSLRAARREVALMDDVWVAEAARLTSVTPTPVAVVTSGESQSADPAYAGLQREIAGLSSTSRSETVDDAGHESLLTDRRHAERVADAIHWVIDNHAAARQSS